MSHIDGVDASEWIPTQVFAAIAAADSKSSARESSSRLTSAATCGKNGVAELELLADGPGHRYFRAPLSSGRILRSDPSSKATQVAYLRSTGGGLAQGDTQHISAQVRSGAHLLLTTQTATRVHTMDTGFALQKTQLNVDDGGILEYLPDPVITSAHSRYLQHTLVDVSPNAIAIVGDAFSAGRIAMGEHHEADVVFLRSQLRQMSSPQSAQCFPIFNEQALYQGKSALSLPIIHGRYTAWANLWVVTPDRGAVKRVLDQWRNYHEPESNREQQIFVGASVFSAERGCWARFMGNSMEDVLRTQHEYWARARRIVLGLDAFDLRKM